MSFGQRPFGNTIILQERKSKYATFFPTIAPQAERPAIKRPFLQLGQDIPTGDLSPLAMILDF